MTDNLPLDADIKVAKYFMMSYAGWKSSRSAQRELLLLQRSFSRQLLYVRLQGRGKVTAMLQTVQEGEAIAHALCTSKKLSPDDAVRMKATMERLRVAISLVI